MKKHWVEITFVIPYAWAEILPGFLEELGFSGLWMDEERDRPEKSVIRAYMAQEHWDPALEQRIKGHLANLSDIFSRPGEQGDVRVRVIEEEDWASKWLPFFEPLKIGSVWIRPTQKSIVLAEDEQEIILDPGQAFGTGHHATTQMCMEATVRLGADLERDAPILDLGTGSGILAMLAARIGFTSILALDVDPVALETARKNLVVNGLEEVIQLDTVSLDCVEASFRLVLANLSASILKVLGKEITSHVEPRGWVAVSGILCAEAGHVERFLSATGLTCTDRREQDEWACLVFRRSDDAKACFCSPTPTVL